MTSETDKYATFVDHPRYGRRPLTTGLNPAPDDDGVNLHWNTTTASEVIAQYEAAFGEPWPFPDLRDYSHQTMRIENTAVVADLSRQTPATVPVTHYFDLERKCHDCGRPFIFFAAEQKHWYEELGFGLNSDCIRCVDCRKRQQGIARKRELYESLFHIQDKTEDQIFLMADACLSLIEFDVFSTRQTDRVRQLLKSIPAAAEIRSQSLFADLLERLMTAEQK